MNRKIRTGYENIGASSYLTAALSPDQGLINYQLEMIVSNQISHFLPASKRMLDGETIIYYNITSLITLEQLLSRRKLKRKEALCLVKGAITAIRDAREYQLPMSGLNMEPDYIYLDPASCEPKFLFLPASEPETGTLRELLLNLVMQGRIEMSNDNFVQVLLETINQEPLSIDALEACIGRYGAVDSAKSERKPGPQPQSQPVRTPVIPQPVNPQPVPAAPIVPPSPVQAENVSREADPGRVMPEKPERPKTFGKTKASKADKKADKKADRKSGKKKESGLPENGDDFDREAAKKKFLLPQAVVMVAFAAAISFGLFLDETGAPAISNILAAVIVLVLFEVILYREVYVNSRQPKKEKKGKKTDRRAVKESGGARPVPPSGRISPVKAERAESQPPHMDFMRQPQTPAAQGDSAQRSSVPVPQVIPSAPQASQYQEMNFRPIPAAPNIGSAGDSETDLNMETELFDGFSGGMAAYLEYYENGLMTRVPLNKSSVLIGRLAGQVDFAVSNPRVGKVHAEFVCQDGHFYVKDISSKNGTYINGSGRINSNVLYPLHDNDRIKLADCEFTIRCSD